MTERAALVMLIAVCKRLIRCHKVREGEHPTGLFKAMIVDLEREVAKAEKALRSGNTP